MAWLLSLGMVSLGLVFYIDVIWPLQAALAVCVILVLVYELFNHIFIARVHTLIRLTRMDFRLESQHRQWDNMQLLRHSIITPFWMILHFRSRESFWCRKTVVIVPDMLSQDAYRRLRVYLKHLYPKEYLAR